VFILPIKINVCEGTWARKRCPNKRIYRWVLWYRGCWLFLCNELILKIKLKLGRSTLQKFYNRMMRHIFSVCLVELGIFDLVLERYDQHLKNEHRYIDSYGHQRTEASPLKKAYRVLVLVWRLDWFFCITIVQLRLSGYKSKVEE